jgi:hypothetical protein
MERADIMNVSCKSVQLNIRKQLKLSLFDPILYQSRFAGEYCDFSPCSKRKVEVFFTVIPPAFFGHFVSWHLKTRHILGQSLIRQLKAVA